ncbi:AI-2E family transporter [Boudabousia liubingyangii]|nr:AI-2E family transporter [Boudabousia liubingyangii]
MKNTNPSSSNRLAQANSSKIGRRPTKSSAASTKAKKRSRPRRHHTTEKSFGLASYAPHWLLRAGIDAWLLIGIFVLLWWLIDSVVQLQAVFFAVFLGLLFTTILNPIVNALSRFLPRPLSVFLSIIGSLGLIVGLVIYVITSVAGTWTSLLAQFGYGINQIIDYLDRPSINQYFKVAKLENWFQQKLYEYLQFVAEHSGEFAGQIASNAAAVGLGLTVFALAVFVSVFTLNSGEKMWRWCLNQLPHRYRAKTHHAAIVGWNTFAGYARGTMIIAATDALLVLVFLTILSIPLAAPLSVIVLIGAFIPLIGAPISMSVAMVVALATKGAITALIVGVGIFLIGQIEGQILQPLIMAHQVSLHPMVVGLAVTAGTFLGGLLGAVIIIPILAVIWSVYAELRHIDPPLIGALPSFKDFVPTLKKPVSASKPKSVNGSLLNGSKSAASALAPNQPKALKHPDHTHTDHAE